MELWRGTMTSHSVVAYRNDANRKHINFDSACWSRPWSNFVPTRLPNTLCVQQRLPSGAAGVLLNRSHQFHDLLLVVNAHEKKMFDLIDGRRSIAEIVDSTGPGSTNPLHFFRDLWRYDQVVFDTSQS